MISNKFMISLLVGFILTVLGILTLNSPVILDNLVGIILFLGGFAKMSIACIEYIKPSAPKRTNSK